MTDKPCCKYWSITDILYEIYQRYKSISDSFAIFANFFKNIVISLIIIAKIVLHFNFPITNKKVT